MVAMTVFGMTPPCHCWAQVRLTRQANGVSEPWGTAPPMFSGCVEGNGASSQCYSDPNMDKDSLLCLWMTREQNHIHLLTL